MTDCEKILSENLSASWGSGAASRAVRSRKRLRSLWQKGFRINFKAIVVEGRAFSRPSSVGWLVLALTLTCVVVGCSSLGWATVRVRNLSSEILTDVRLTGSDPHVAFGYCGPDADKSTCLGDSITFHPDAAMEYTIDGKVLRQPLNQGGAFPAKLPNRDKIMELQFTTNRVWTWTLKEGSVVQ